MKLKEINNLVELFFKKLEQKSFEERNELFLISLKTFSKFFFELIKQPFVFTEDTDPIVTKVIDDSFFYIIFI